MEVLVMEEVAQLDKPGHSFGLIGKGTGFPTFSLV